ncbi:hypothetical protein HAX54_012221 [Datura stramonium]|uniref:Uncharacterized protein n=1 Tax=Datura stramonium TaxID=4076 RepID=A0ABS8TL46_DATST|nr:hypothetical protein [Datura stramonium]
MVRVMVAAAAAAAAAGGVSGYGGVDLIWILNLLSHSEFQWRRRGEAEAAAKRLQKSCLGVLVCAFPLLFRAGEVGWPQQLVLEDENALLQQALAMSMDDSSSNVATRDTDMSEAASEDQDLALGKYGIGLAYQIPQFFEKDSTNDQSNQTDMSKLLADQSFVSSILASLPGVDPNDPSVKDLLASMQGQSSEKKDEDNDKEQKEDKK